MIFYLALIDKKTSKRRYAIPFVIFGTILLSLIVGYAGIKYVAYLRAPSSDLIHEPFPLFILNGIQITGINLIASILILIGIKHSIILKSRKLYLIWIPTLLLIPLVFMLINILQLYKIGI